MARIRLDIGEEAFNRLIEAAASEHRPPQWHAEYLLLKALGMPEGEEPQNKGTKIRQLVSAGRE